MGRISVQPDVPRAAKRRANYLARKHLRHDKPCEKCGTKPAHRHHEDYSKPLEIMWLCVKCHGLHHSQFEGKPAPDPIADIRLVMSRLRP